MRVSMMVMISGMLVLTRGSSVGRAMPRASMSW